MFQKDSYIKTNCGKCKESLLNNKPIELSGLNFDEVVVNSEIPVIVDFWASWCGPCKMFAPIFNDVSKKYPLKATFTKSKHRRGTNFSLKYMIKSIPTFSDFLKMVRVKE